MDPLFEYAYYWLRATALRLYRPFDISLNRERVQNIERVRPGFGAQLRLVALDALQSGDRPLVHKAIAALAIVGTEADRARLQSLPPEHEATVRTAIFEIEHASPAS